MAETQNQFRKDAIRALGIGPFGDEHADGGRPFVLKPEHERPRIREPKYWDDDERDRVADIQVHVQLEREDYSDRPRWVYGEIFFSRELDQAKSWGRSRS